MARFGKVIIRPLDLGVSLEFRMSRLFGPRVWLAIQVMKLAGMISPIEVTMKKETTDV